MVFTVEFADGTNAQISATSALAARRVAIVRYRGRLVLGVRPAGLLDIAYRRPPEVQSRKS